MSFLKAIKFKDLLQTKTSGNRLYVTNRFAAFIFVMIKVFQADASRAQAIDNTGAERAILSDS